MGEGECRRGYGAKKIVRGDGMAEASGWLPWSVEFVRLMGIGRGGWPGGDWVGD